MPAKLGMKTPPRQERSRWETHLALLAAVVLGSTGCNPVFAPPVRTNHFSSGSPVPEGELQMTLGGTIHGVGSVQLSSGLSEQLQWEAGAEVSPEWALAVAGVRRTSLPRDSTDLVRTDFEIGAGLGLGGSCDQTWCDDRSPFERTAGGIYAGFGASVVGERFALRMQIRGQRTKASGIPATNWYTAVIGPQLTAGGITMHLAAGAGRYTNAQDHQSGPLLEFVIAMRSERDSR